MQNNSISETTIETTLICPSCGHRSVEQVPTDACVFYQECSSCNTLLRPKPSDCCVFCSFDLQACPHKTPDVAYQ